MFKQDQQRIEQWCRNPDKFMSVGVMVLLSIQQQWVGVGNAMADVSLNGEQSKALWGHKRAGYVYLRDNRNLLYGFVKRYRSRRIERLDLMRELIKVPGLGLAKAGFLMQLTCGVAGCMDLHNVERFGLNPKSWQVRTFKDTAKQMREIDDKIRLYLHLCIMCGGTEKLWDTWCEHMAARWPKTFHNADDVSRRHWIYLQDLPGDGDDS